MKHPEIITQSKLIRLPEDPDHEYYIPGYLLQKIVFVLFTGVIVGISLIDMGPKLWTIATGESLQAEVASVIKTTADGTEEVFTNDAKARDSYDEENRTITYHNTLSFRLPDDSTHEARLKTGSLLKPPYDILDSSGLPTTVLIAYHPDTPDHIVLPTSLSTWFFPVIIFLFGFAGMVVAVYYLITCVHPLQVPHLHAPPGENLAETEEDDGEPDMDVKKKDS